MKHQKISISGFCNARRIWCWAWFVFWRDNVEGWGGYTPYMWLESLSTISSGVMPVTSFTKLLRMKLQASQKDSSHPSKQSIVFSWKVCVVSRQVKRNYDSQVAQTDFIIIIRRDIKQSKGKLILLLG